MNKEIFSQEALDNFHALDDLNSQLTVTQPVGWIAILSLCLLVVSIIIWSVFGVMSVSVPVVGMIIDPDGVVNIYHDKSGKIAQILVYPGARVSKGDVVAKLSQPSLANAIITQRANLAASMGWGQVRKALLDFDAAVNEWTLSSNIISEYDGLVTEVQVNKGDVVTAGATSLCSIRQNHDREDTIAVMYAALEFGKKIKPGMIVQITPSGVDVKEDGNLVGVVRDVSLYPVSSAGIQRVLGNANVVNWILGQTNGAAMEIRVDLVKDETSVSGYLWSSIIGSHPEITVGSACSGSIVVDRRAPISKIFLKFGQWLRNS